LIFDAGDYMKVATGIILSVVAGYYFVENENTTYLCRGRGKLRQGGSPLAGDFVRFSADQGASTGTVEEVLPRRNQLRRPAIANIDAVVIVIAPESPEPDLLMVDKLLAFLMEKNLEAIICVNKIDANPCRAQEVARVYQSIGFQTITCSALTGQGMEALSSAIGAKTAVLAGQSGVGKSRITTGIAVGELDIPVQIGKVSAKIGRGKHTTRQVSLLPLASGGKLADTPGFSVFELDLDSRDLHRVYPEFLHYSQDCQFTPCTHVHEPGCAVKEHLGKGEIDPGRYKNYLRIYQDLKEKEANRY